MLNECALTTIDNPYNPFTQFDDWFMFDIEHNYWIDLLMFLMKCLQKKRKLLLKTQLMK